jgi:hypothetical protein
VGTRRRTEFAEKVAKENIQRKIKLVSLPISRSRPAIKLKGPAEEENFVAEDKKNSY